MIDLRSDTVTRPTPHMRERMFTAPVGDDVYGDDPTVLKLEALAAALTGKEAALFVCSGTMGNQLAIMTHTRPGEEIILGHKCHIIEHECGAYARLSGVTASLVDTAKGGITGEDVIAHLRERDNIHHPLSSLLCLENPMADGRLVSLHLMRDAADAAHAHGLLVHLDGARLFNAAEALGVSAAEIVRDCDSVMFCLSKGLCAPVGSMLCGSADFVARARRNRKVLGGGLRQAGVLAACGLVSLEEMTARLKEDHDNARFLAEALNALPGVAVDLPSVQINMVFTRINAPGFDDEAFFNHLQNKGVLINGVSDGFYRFVTHNDVSREDLESAVAVMKGFIEG